MLATEKVTRKTLNDADQKRLVEDALWIRLQRTQRGE